MLDKRFEMRVGVEDTLPLTLQLTLTLAFIYERFHIECRRSGQVDEIRCHLRRSRSVVTIVILWWLFDGYFEDISRLFEGYFEIIWKLFNGCI